MRERRLQFRLITACLVALVGVAIFAAPAFAPRAPRNCGIVRVDGRSYTIKADISCTKAKTYSRRYLDTGRRPSGWQCRRYNTKLKFRCTKGDFNFYALRR